jgi:hypothetical protein
MRTLSLIRYDGVAAGLSGFVMPDGIISNAVRSVMRRILAESQITRQLSDRHFTRVVFESGGRVRQDVQPSDSA